MTDSLRPPRFGKYRGTVVNNVDPQQRGRLQVQVPAIYGSNALGWALPCVPFAGRNAGFYAMPDIGALVWVEFEAGDIDYPIWSGCFWSEGDCPGQLPQVKIVKTAAATITLNDLNPASPVTIETAGGQRLVLTATGVRLESAGGAIVELSGPQLSVNNGALEVL